MNSFEKLPLEIKFRIFKYLDLNLLLKFRVLNKTIKNAVDSLRIKKLCITRNTESITSKFVSLIRILKCHHIKQINFFTNQDFDLTNAERFFCTNDLIKNCEVFLTSNRKVFQSNFMKLILSNIKKLYINEPLTNKLRPFNLRNNLNELKSLEQLQITCLHIRKGSSLRLPKLCILNIEKYYPDAGVYLRLETPELFAFRTESSLADFRFDYPDKITYLLLSKSPYCCQEDLESFFNLKHLFVEDTNSKFYHKLPNFSRFTQLEEVYFNDIKNCELNCLARMQKEEKLKFKFYLKGIYFETISEAINFDVNTKRWLENWTENLTEKHYLNSYEFLYFTDEIDYTSFFNSLILPEDFGSKFIFLIKVNVIETEALMDGQLLLKFLSKIETLRILDISKKRLGQSFYNELPSNCLYLNRLVLPFTEKTDLNFLLDLKDLKQIAVGYPPSSIDMFRNIFKNLKDLRSFISVINSRKLELYKYNEKSVHINSLDENNSITYMGKFSGIKQTFDFFQNLEHWKYMQINARKKLFRLKNFSRNSDL